MAIGNATVKPFSGEFLVNTTTRIDQYKAAVAAFSSGGFVVAWTDRSQTGGISGITADDFLL